MRGRDKFQKYKFGLNLVKRIFLIFPYTIRVKFFEHYRMIKGIKGLGIRYALLSSICKKCGDNVAIHPNVYLYNMYGMYIGNNVSIHPMCYIDGFGGIEIGDNVSIAHGVTIMSTEHIFDRIDIPIKDQGTYGEKVIINENVWIGAKAVILAGVTIGRGSIIGAGAVVTKDVSQDVIVGGVPAKLIRKRI